MIFFCANNTIKSERIESIDLWVSWDPRRLDMVSSRFCRRSRTFWTVRFLWDSGSAGERDGQYFAPPCFRQISQGLFPRYMYHHSEKSSVTLCFIVYQAEVIRPSLVGGWTTSFFYWCWLEKRRFNKHLCWSTWSDTQESIAEVEEFYIKTELLNWTCILLFNK